MEVWLNKNKIYTNIKVFRVKKNSANSLLSKLWGIYIMKIIIKKKSGTIAWGNLWKFYCLRKQICPGLKIHNQYFFNIKESLICFFEYAKLPLSFELINKIFTIFLVRLCKMLHNTLSYIRLIKYDCLNILSYTRVIGTLLQKYNIKVNYSFLWT